MYITLLEVYFSSFSAVATYTFNWPMVYLLRNRHESLDWIVPAFKYNQLKRKGNMKSAVCKYTVESVVHSIWKEYGNCNISLLMPE